MALNKRTSVKLSFSTSSFTKLHISRYFQSLQQFLTEVPDNRFYHKAACASSIRCRGNWSSYAVGKILLQTDLAGIDLLKSQCESRGIRLETVIVVLPIHE